MLPTLLLGLLAAPLAAQAETLAYPDDFPPRTLQTVNGAADALAPTGSSGGKSNSLSNNHVTLNSGVVSGSVYGAVNLVDTNVVSGNEVTINDGGVQGYVIGGLASTLANGGDATASGNSVTINGGMGSYPIFGGYAQADASGTATASNNTVTISGTPVFDPNNTVISGGYAIGGNNVSLNNRLHLYSGVSVQSVANFQSLAFHLPATLPAGGTMLTAEYVTITDAVIHVELEGTGPALSTGQTFTLIDTTAASGGLVGTFNPASASGVVGGYNYTLTQSGGQLVLTLGAPLAPASTAAASVPTLHPAGLALLGLLLASGMGLARRRA